MPPGGNRSNKTDSESYQSNSWKSIHSYFYLRFFLFLFKLIVSYIHTHTHTSPCKYGSNTVIWFGGMFQNAILKKFRFNFILKDFVHLCWVTPLIWFSGLFPARTRAPDWPVGSSIAACARTVTRSTWPRGEAGPRHQGADRAGKKRRSASTSLWPFGAEVAGALQLGEAQVTERAAARIRGATHTIRTPAPLLELVIPPPPNPTPTPNTWTFRVQSALVPVRLGHDSCSPPHWTLTGRSADATLHSHIGSNALVTQTGGTGLNIEIQVIPSRFCKRTNKILLIVRKDWPNCLFIRNIFFPWIYCIYFLVEGKLILL